MTLAPERTIVERPWPFHTCPTCEGEAFSVEAPEHAVVFCCLGCGDRWRFVLGYLHRVPGQAQEAPAAPLTPPTTLVSPSARMASGPVITIDQGLVIRPAVA